MPQSAPAASIPSHGLQTFLRSTVASLACIVVEYALLTVFVSRFRMNYLVASVLAGVVYLFLNFFLSRAWAFKASPLKVKSVQS